MRTDFKAGVDTIAAKTTKPLPHNLICFSHLRWDFVYQRPQHLLSRLAKQFLVYFIEEPIFDAIDPHYTFRVVEDKDNITVMIPHLPPTSGSGHTNDLLKQLLDEFMEHIDIKDTAFWYYTPMALSFTRQFEPALTIFDCMDELSAFKFAPQELKDMEQELLLKADVVFTGGDSLYNAKKHRHNNIHSFPSSIDKQHFGQARNISIAPADQANIPFPRIGFFGVIDERFDIELIKGVAERRPDWHLVIIGPVVKIDPSTLPQLPNIHYLGGKSYDELPHYVAGWSIATIPFALNESTKFISPTKTPEYLAAGVPVISTSIRDVVTPYGDKGLVYIADTVDEFVEGANCILYNEATDARWLNKVDDFLSTISWDNTVANMLQEIRSAYNKTKAVPFTNTIDLKSINAA